MALLKEIKTRLQSVHSTQKITTAMMMVASARLHKTQQLIHSLYPYEQELFHILQLLLSKQKKFDSPYMKKREVKRVAIVAFASNTGLAGRFNHNIVSKLFSVVDEYHREGLEDLLIYTFGSEVEKAVKKKGMVSAGNFDAISSKPSYDSLQKVAGQFMQMFTNEEVDRVELIYHHFKSKGVQEVRHELFLPVELKLSADQEHNGWEEYIVEPDKLTLLNELLPKVIKLKLYSAHVDSLTSEHAARMTAMQIANDNADELIDELRLEYNKLRQQSITNELLDIAGGMVR